MAKHNKKAKAKAKAIAGGMPQKVADKVFRMEPGKANVRVDDNAFPYRSQEIMAKLPGFAMGHDNDSKSGESTWHSDPQYSYKLSKKKQMEVLKRLSADAEGGDIRNITNKPGTNEMWHPQIVSTTKTGSTHTDFNFTNTFNEAFKSARARHGSGGTFSWRGKKYTTKIKGE